MSSNLEKETNNLNVINEYKNLSSCEINEIVKNDRNRDLNYAICALNVQGNLNIGNMIRTSHICGASKFIIFGRRKYNKSSAVGTFHYMDIDKVDGLKKELKHFDFSKKMSSEEYKSILWNGFDEVAFKKYMKENNFIPIFIEQNNDSVKLNNNVIKSIFQNINKINIHKCDSNKRQKLDKYKPCFVFGNESFGIPENILNTRNEFPNSIVIEIPQVGIIKSHNVGISCGIVSYKIMEVLMEALIK